MKPILTLFIAAILFGSINCKRGIFAERVCNIDSTYNYCNIDSIPAKVILANAFTPNGDGLNDCYRPAGNKVPEMGYSFKVMKRSKVLLSTNNKYFSWNGTNANGEFAGAGKYKVIATAVLDGVTKTIEGEVTLLLRDRNVKCIGTSDFSSLTFQDMIDPHMGFSYATKETICTN